MAELRPTLPLALSSCIPFNKTAESKKLLLGAVCSRHYLCTKSTNKGFPVLLPSHAVQNETWQRPDTDPSNFLWIAVASTTAYSHQDASASVLPLHVPSASRRCRGRWRSPVLSPTLALGLFGLRHRFFVLLSWNKIVWPQDASPPTLSPSVTNSGPQTSAMWVQDIHHACKRSEHVPRWFHPWALSYEISPQSANHFTIRRWRTLIFFLFFAILCYK